MHQPSNIGVEHPAKTNAINLQIVRAAMNSARSALGVIILLSFLLAYAIVGKAYELAGKPSPFDRDED